MMESFDDIYVGEGVNINDVRGQFYGLYTPRNIIFECVKQQIEQSSELRGKLIDWFKVNLPADWQKDEFQKIRQDVQSKPTDDEKKKHLETLDIFVAPNQTIDDAIEDERRMRYLGQEVIVDMQSAKMEIKPTAIAFMLERMQVLKPVYDWSYYQPLVGFSKAVVTAAWSGVRGILKSFF